MKKPVAKDALASPTLLGAVGWGLVLAIGFAVVVYASTISAEFVYGNV